MEITADWHHFLMIDVKGFNGFPFIQFTWSFISLQGALKKYCPGGHGIDSYVLDLGYNTEIAFERGFKHGGQQVCE